MRVRDMMVRANTTSDQENVELPPTGWSTTRWPWHPAAPRPAAAALHEREGEQRDQGGVGQRPASIGYTLIGNMIELVPAPGDNVDLKMVYYARIPSLSATQPPATGCSPSHRISTCTGR